MAFSINDKLTAFENYIGQCIQNNQHDHCEDTHFKDKYLLSRIDSLCTAVIETVGALIATICIIPAAGLRLLGEILEIPSHIHRAWRNCTNFFKGFCRNGIVNTLTRVGKLYAGAISSFAVGTVLYPPANNNFHAKVIVPGKTDLL